MRYLGDIGEERRELLIDRLERRIGLHQLLSSLTTTADQAVKKQLVADIMSELGHGGLFLERAHSTVSSEDYWNRHFELHPSERPSKIVWYNGDPVGALRQWKQEMGIENRGHSADLGFSESMLSTREDPRVIAGIDRRVLSTLAAIDQRFGADENETDAMELAPRPVAEVLGIMRSLKQAMGTVEQSEESFLETDVDQKLLHAYAAIGAEAERNRFMLQLTQGRVEKKFLPVLELLS
jgi:hypothetical protein